MRVKEKIFEKRYDGIRNGILFSDLPKDLLSTDIIDIQKDEGYFSENNSWDAFTELVVFRERDETEEELQRRKDVEKTRVEELKNSRFLQYQKLKKEFES